MATPPHQFRSTLCAALAGGAGLLSLHASPVLAGGFSGSFAPSNWTLSNYQTSTYPATTGAASSAGDPAYNCPAGIFVTCVLDLDAPAGVATVIGSNYDDADPTNSNGGPSQSWVTQWELTSPYAGPSPFSLTFDWSFLTSSGQDEDQSYYYIIDDLNNIVDTQLLSSNDGDIGFQTVILQSGWRLGFGVATVGNNGGPGLLTITNFNPTSDVPGPLPLLGAAAAFGVSRRLRRRIGTGTGTQLTRP